MGEREGWSWTDSSFSIRSAKALRVMSKGSNPKSSSCCLEEPNPKAACQSVEEDTGIVSAGEEQDSEQELVSIYPYKNFSLSVSESMLPVIFHVILLYTLPKDTLFISLECHFQIKLS